MSDYKFKFCHYGITFSHARRPLAQGFQWISNVKVGSFSFQSDVPRWVEGQPSPRRPKFGPVWNQASGRGKVRLAYWSTVGSQHEQQSYMLTSRFLGAWSVITQIHDTVDVKIDWLLLPRLKVVGKCQQETMICLYQNLLPHLSYEPVGLMIVLLFSPVICHILTVLRMNILVASLLHYEAN